MKVEMLRLHVSCSHLIPNIRQPKSTVTNSTGGSWVIRSVRRFPLQSFQVKALRDEANNGSTRGFTGQNNWDPGLEIEVPFEQRPVNEYTSLKDGPLYSWGELSPGSFFIRLGTLWLITFTALGAPIAAASFSPSRKMVSTAMLADTKDSTDIGSSEVTRIVSIASACKSEKYRKAGEEKAQNIEQSLSPGATSI